MCCSRIGNFKGRKTFPVTPTKQDLGTKRVLFKIYNEHPCPFYKGVPHSPGRIPLPLCHNALDVLRVCHLQ